MFVEVTFSAELHELAKAIKLVLSLPDGSTVMDLIMSLSRINPVIPTLLIKNGKLSENYVVIVNGRDIDWLDGLSTKLNDGDKVLIAPKAFIS
ncbi:MAG: MoaD/ThiS family protein [Vulcanisaeta sp.]